MDKKLLIVLLSLFFAFAVLPISQTNAIVPVVRNVTSYNVGPNTWLNITIYHYPEDPSSDPPHFVDQLWIDSNGNVTLQSIGAVIHSPPQETFTWQYKVGPSSGTPSVTVYAHCNLDGWSKPGPSVPSFAASAASFAAIVAVFLVAFVLILLVFINDRARNKAAKSRQQLKQTVHEKE